MVGVAAASSGKSAVLIAGVAGLVAGAMSMAAGEFVSVNSQAGSEKTDLAREWGELNTDPAAELDELTGIYVARGLTPELARQVAEQLTSGDVLAAHARDELGITDFSSAKPIQAALTSAATFTAGAAAPLLVVAVSPLPGMGLYVSAASLAALAVLGAIGARAGGAPVLKATFRVTFWGALAMALTAGIGHLFGAVV